MGGSLGGGTGGNAAKLGEIGAGAGMEVPLVREVVDGGKGGSLYEEEEDGRPLSVDERDVLEEALNDRRWSEAMAYKVSASSTKLEVVSKMQQYVVLQKIRQHSMQDENLETNGIR